MQARKNVVISCGGGTPLRECNVVEMKKNGRVVLLTASPEAIFDRVKDSHDRPVIENNKNVPFIANLMGKRRVKYEAAADIIINMEAFTGDDAVKAVVEEAHKHGVKVVASNHDFDKTPAKSDIIYRLRKMQELGADIPKIAVMPQNKKDVLTLLAATGVISRICGK